MGQVCIFFLRIYMSILIEMKRKHRRKDMKKKSDDWNITSKYNADDIFTILLFIFSIIAIITILVVTIICGIGLMNTL